MQQASAKTILTKAPFEGGNWFSIDYHMNLYRGCCHGCIYCDSRSDCYNVENFDTVRVKEHALAILEREIRQKKSAGVVGFGAMSDSYNPFEREQQITRSALALLERYGFGVSIETKSDLIVRDIDIFTDLSRRAPAILKMTVTTADDALAARLEPHAPPPSKRFEALTGLSAAGLCTGILLMPVLPFLTDTAENIKAIVRRGHECGVRFIYPQFGVTLRGRQRAYFYDRLEESFPGLKRCYQGVYGESYLCKSPKAKELYALLQNECERYGIAYRMQDITRLARRDYPVSEQLRLF